MPKGFQIETQKKLHWCWAAVGVSIKRYFSSGSQLKQCELAEDVLGKRCCENSDVCNESARLERALEIVGALNGRRLPTFLDFARIVDEIDEGRPVCARIGWFGENGGHFVVITGYWVSSTGDEWVHVADPFHVDSTMPYEQFVHSYLDAGEWTDTFLLKDSNS